jgi:hypothetical protein
VEIPGDLYCVPRDGSATPELLVDAQSYPVALVADAEHVCWANTGTATPACRDGQIVRYTKATGETGLGG